ncbi:forkhead box protein H1-like [Myxocyprinus asiaticus]|uniref:forkhead box protein H1-like n=1 Tax=Myxocyprinus asiaticus TaxID=70543 RepID=UPI002222776C|nr:forkhead box protein H1-like [Myxocyprinus asiaticus]
MANRMKGEFSNQQTQPCVKKRRYKKYITGSYIGLIASAIQDSQGKMLTFKEIMKTLEPFVFGNRKGAENNIRVCLSSNSCFVKVPVNPEYPNPKKNYWKVDESGITPKMLRRHFKHIIDKFPGLSLQAPQRDECGENCSAPKHLLPACSVPENKSEAKFTGPFSIESLLKSDHKVIELEEYSHYKDTRCAAMKRKNCYDYDTTGCYYPNSTMGSEFYPAEFASVCRPTVRTVSFADFV